jgi:hypothetical protein
MLRGSAGINAPVDVSMPTFEHINNVALLLVMDWSRTSVVRCDEKKYNIETTKTTAETRNQCWTCLVSYYASISEHSFDSNRPRDGQRT